MTVMATEAIPLEERIAVVQRAVTAVKTKRDSIDPNSFDRRSDRAAQQEALDILLDELSALYLDRLLDA